MPWPGHIVEQFGTVTPPGELDDSVVSSSSYSQDRSISWSFPSTSAPHILSPSTSQQSSLFNTTSMPFFFVEIKPSGHLRTISDHSAADQQMREQFDALADQLSILTLYGISALGTKLCIYTYDSVTGTLEPEALKWIREELTKELPPPVGTSM
ncbi:hypothetical protein PAXINDRAFT_102325 [Paxillus involutus ATCC 200175]|uniref:Uncharacterized protein n=1 Tax=Paxillus involutus ATCC 200175 TaxID=664439 RepID=A0A0C9TPV8_PAXIN|nr:hypothetical protein PAXINDRAFT_102325 [Paxillus involutus ATCC 200175]